MSAADSAAPEVDALDLSQFDEAAVEARQYVERERAAANSAASRGDAKDEDDRQNPGLLDLDKINTEGNRVARMIESTTLRLRSLHQMAEDHEARYQEARAKAMLSTHAPTKGEREALADTHPQVAALKDAAHYAEIAVKVADKACTNLGRVLDWRTAQLYKGSKLVDDR